MSSRLPFMRLVPHFRVIFHQARPSSGWSFIRCVSHHGDLSSGLSLITLVFRQTVLWCSFIILVFHWGFAVQNSDLWIYLNVVLVPRCSLAWGVKCMLIAYYPLEFVDGCDLDEGSTEWWSVCLSLADFIFFFFLLHVSLSCELSLFLSLSFFLSFSHDLSLSPFLSL